VRGRKPPPGTYNEAVYSSASKLLNGQLLTHAQEMGGFKLGSTIECQTLISADGRRVGITHALRSEEFVLFRDV
jgi:hypothetical protein